MKANTIKYGFGVTVPLSYGEAVERTRAALPNAGFGVLTEIDIGLLLPCTWGCTTPASRGARSSRRSIPR